MVREIESDMTERRGGERRRREEEERGQIGKHQGSIKAVMWMINMEQLNTTSHNRDENAEGYRERERERERVYHNKKIQKTGETQGNDNAVYRGKKETEKEMGV